MAGLGRCCLRREAGTVTRACLHTGMVRFPFTVKLLRSLPVHEGSRSRNSQPPLSATRKSCSLRTSGPEAIPASAAAMEAASQFSFRLSRTPLARCRRDQTGCGFGWGASNTSNGIPSTSRVFVKHDVCWVSSDYMAYATMSSLFRRDRGVGFTTTHGQHRTRHRTFDSSPLQRIQTHSTTTARGIVT